MNRHFIFLVLLLLCISPVSVLAEHQAPDETALLSYLQQTDAFYTGRGLTYNSVFIEKRQTRLSEWTDYVWVRADAVCEAFSVTLHAKITSTLYNDGWHIENVQADNRDAWTATPFQGVSDAALSSILKDTGYYYAENAVLDKHELDLTAGRETYIYNITKTKGAVTRIYKLHVPFAFNGEKGEWEGKDKELTDLNTVWNTIALAGEYTDWDDMPGISLHVDISVSGQISFDCTKRYTKNPFYGYLSLNDFTESHDLFDFEYRYITYGLELDFEVEDGLFVSPITNKWDSVMLDFQ